MNKIALICLIRDPKGTFITPIKEHSYRLIEIYPETTIIASQDTSPDTIRALRENGCQVKTQSGKGVGEARRDALRTAIQNKFEYIHLCDLDRALHWTNTYPAELKHIKNVIPEHDFLILGRTPRAFETHPEPQKMTESLTNQVFSFIYKQPIDVNTASRGVSYKAAEVILRYSHASGFETDVEWPLIIKLKTNLNLGYMEVEGLEYETHIKCPEEIRKAGGLQNWKRMLERDPNEWLRRVNIARRMIETAIRTQEKLMSRRAQ